MSSGSFFFASPLVSVLAVASFLAGASVLVCASAGEKPSETVTNRTAINTATSLNIGILRVTVGNADMASAQYTSKNFNDLHGVSKVRQYERSDIPESLALGGAAQAGLVILLVILM